MASVYLHIGTPKTGTSYIQLFMRLNHNALKKNGCTYPTNYPVEDYLPQRNGHFLVQPFRTGISKKARELADKKYQEYFSDIASLSRKYEKIILSEEMVWNLYRRDEALKQLKQYIDRYHLDLKLIVYLRRQDLYLQSHWAQKVQKFETRDFKTYLSENKFRMDYFESLNELSEIVGRENLIVRVYEKQQWKNGLLIDDFLDAVGIKKTADFAEPEDDVVNISLSGKYLEFKRCMNRFEEFSAKKKDILYNALSELMVKNHPSANYKSNVYMDHGETVDFLSGFQDGNRKVAEEYLHRADGILFRDAIAENTAPRPEYTPDDLLEVAKEVILYQAEQYEALKESEKGIRKVFEKFPHLRK